MYFIVIFMLSLLAINETALADSGRSATVFSDGTLIGVEVAASKGIAEIGLPSGMLEDSLRIRPLGNTVIERVDVVSSRREGKGARELENLLEQKSRLEDRLQALGTREDIFKAAAKSQSGKAPRKTKANPDPMQSIRQGTDFAIAQLEAVYTARRKTEQDIRRLDARIGALRKGGQGEETIARIALSPKNGRVRVRYALAGVGWTPRYDLRLNNDGNASLALYGQLPAGFSGYLLRASQASMADSSAARPLPVAAGSLAKLAEYRLPARDERFGNGVRSSFSVVLTNPGNANLPTGDATLYRGGEYWSRFRFEGISSGRSRKVTFGM
jgi:hypothetical protein